MSIDSVAEVAIGAEDVLVLQERLAGLRPRLRGVFHLLTVPLAVVATTFLAAIADDGRSQLAAVVFGASMTTLFATSAAYHRIDWSPAWALRMKRADHVAIVIALAGTYTPFALLVLDGPLAFGVLAAGWTSVAASVVMAGLGLFERRGVAITAYLVLGWAALAMIPTLADRLPRTDIAWIVGGGVTYSIGAAVLATRWPNPSPSWFGFHEVWHFHTIVAAAMHTVAVASVVSAGPIS